VAETVQIIWLDTEVGNRYGILIR